MLVSLVRCGILPDPFVKKDTNLLCGHFLTFPDSVDGLYIYQVLDFGPGFASHDGDLVKKTNSFFRASVIKLLLD